MRDDFSSNTRRDIPSGTIPRTLPSGYVLMHNQISIPHGRGRACEVSEDGLT
jgi:hypothetical protein